MKTKRKWLTYPGLVAAALLLASDITQQAQAAGVTDTEIRIGNIMPYTGPLAAFAAIGRAEAAYFDMINERGGIKGARSNSSRATTAPIREWRPSTRVNWSSRSTCT